jgi:hypothetical protein
MKLKIYTALAFSVFLGYLPIVHAFTDTVNNTIPTIETNWKFDQNSGRINLSITNKSDHPIRISPLIETGYSTDLNDVRATILFGTSTRAVQAAVLFIAPKRKDLSYISMREGPEPNPIEIAPGETKNVIFSDEDIILKTKGYTKAKFYLFFNKQIINTVALDNLNNILK